MAASGVCKVMQSANARYLKRELSPLRRACLSLGLRVDARPKTNLTWLLRKAGMGKTAINYLKFSKDEQARQIVALYNALNPTERKAATIDYLIMAAGADVHHISGVIQEERSRADGIHASLLIACNAPHVAQKAIERALTREGHHDRKLIFHMTGLLPSH